VVGVKPLPFATPRDDHPLVRHVASPLTREMLRPLDPRCEFVQFKRLLTDDDYEKLAKFLRKYPDVALRAYGSYDSNIADLEFLRFFPDLRAFSADALYQLEDIGGLRHLGLQLRTLGLGQTKRKLSLHPLERFTNLHRLFLEGHTKDIDVIAGLTEVRSLTLRSITLPDLTLFAPLSKLKALDLKLGGTKNLAGIEAFRDLRYLEVWMVRGLSDLARVASCTSLEMLFLQALKNVTALPDFSALHHLQRIHLETMKGLNDLTPLLNAPALQDVLLVDMGHLQPEQVGVLAGHPNLKRATVGLGSTRKNEAVEELLDLPRADYDLPAYLRGLLDN
jgi:hypothetical protein